MVGRESFRHYRRRALQYGSAFEALEYSLRESQTCRFEAVLRLLQIGGWSHTGLRILDVGCGHADLRGFLRDRGVPVGRYVGVDPVPEMIEEAQRRCPDEEFQCGTVFDVKISERFDAAVAIGIFTVREASQDINQQLVRATLDRLFELSERTACITVLSDRKASVREDEYVTDPWQLAREVQSTVGERVIVDHQELPHVAAIGVFRGPSRWKEAFARQRTESRTELC